MAHVNSKPKLILIIRKVACSLRIIMIATGRSDKTFSKKKLELEKLFCKLQIFVRNALMHVTSSQTSVDVNFWKELFQFYFQLNLTHLSNISCRLITSLTWIWTFVCLKNRVNRLSDKLKTRQSWYSFMTSSNQVLTHWCLYIYCTNHYKSCS